jgi:hypothetical protein
MDETDCDKRFSKGDVMNGFTIFDQWQQHQQWLEQKKLGIVPEPGMAFGPMGIAGVGLHDSELGLVDDGCPSKTLRFMDDGDYLNRAPLSRAVSTLLLNHHHPSNFAGPAFDRQSQFVMGCNSVNSSQISVMRRSHSMNDLNLRTSEISSDIKFGRMDRPRFDYIRSAGRHGRVIARGESDEFHRSYKDVAL